MQRFNSRMMVSVLVALLLAIGLSSGISVAAQEPVLGVSTDWKLEKVGKAYLSTVSKLDLASGGVPLVVYWGYDSNSSTPKLVVAKREAGNWADLDLTTSCSVDDISYANVEIEVDQGQNVYVAYICKGYVYDDLRVARYDKVKQEWRTETVDWTGISGQMHGLSMIYDLGDQLSVGYVLDTGEVRHAWREGQDQWKVSIVSTSADSFSHTAVSSTSSIAFTYRKDGTNYAAFAEKVLNTAGAWKSQKVGEGSVMSRGAFACLGFLNQDKAYFAERNVSGSYISDFVVDRTGYQKLDVTNGCPYAIFAFKRNGGLTMAKRISWEITPPIFDFPVKLVIPDCRPNLADFVMPEGLASIGHALLIDSDNTVYYTSGELPVFASTRKARIRPEGGTISINNVTVPDGTNTPFVEGDNVVAYPAAVKKISYNADCAKGFVEMVALQARPHLPEKYQQLNDTKIAFMILLRSPKLTLLLEALCREETPQAAAAASPDVAEDPYLLLDMESGALAASPMHAEFILDVRTPQANCRTTGGSTAVIAHDPGSNISFFHVTAGSAIVTPADTQQPAFTLQAGQAAEITPTGIEWLDITPPIFLPFISG